MAETNAIESQRDKAYGLLRATRWGLVAQVVLFLAAVVAAYNGGFRFFSPPEPLPGFVLSVSLFVIALISVAGIGALVWGVIIARMGVSHRSAALTASGYGLACFVVPGLLFAVLVAMWSVT